MADRTVRVSLVLQAQGYFQGIDQAAKKTRELGTETEKLEQKRQAFESLGRSAIGFGAAVGVGVGMAVSKYAEFDQQMSYVQAATHETAANMDRLRQASLEAGAQTVYSATEAAGAVEELAKAGVSTRDILGGGLKGALDLAAAGGLAVADAGSIAATALKTFGLRGSEMTHVADLLAAGAGKAQGSVSDISQALSQAGTVASSTGLSLEETTAGLAAFAEQGILGSDAGTSFRSMLMRLTPQSKEAEDAMRELGVSAYDSKGEFIGLEAFAGNLSGVFGEMDTEARNAALGVIFGSDAIRAANILIDNGSAGIRNWITAVDDQGYAAETASIRLDNLRGDWEALTGSVDTAMISMGEAADGPLRMFVQGLTGLVNGFNEAPDWLKDVGTYAGLAGAAIGVAGGLALLAVPKVAGLRTTFSNLNLSMGRTALAGGAVGLALMAVIGVVAAVAAEQEKARQSAKSYADTFTEGAGKITQSARELAAENLSEADGGFLGLGNLTHGGKSALDFADQLGIAMDDVIDAATGGDAAVEAFSARLDEIVAKNPEYTAAAALLEAAVRDENGVVEKGAGLAKQKADATGAAGDAASTAAAQYLEESAAVEDVNGELQGLIDKLNELNGVGQDAISTNANYRAALAEVDETIKKAHEGADGYSTSLDAATEAGSKNQQMFADLARDAQEAATAQFELDGNTQAYRESLENGRQALEDRITDLTGNKDAAKALADQIFQIPSETEWKVIAETQEAKDKAGELQAIIDGLHGKSITVNVNTVYPNGTPLSQTQIDAQLGSAVGIGVVPPDHAAGAFYQRGKLKDLAAGGWANAVPGGLMRVAEAGYDEAIISTDPKYRSRSLGLMGEVGSRIGAWQSAPSYVLAQQSGAGGGGREVHAPITIQQRPGVSDGRIAQVAAEELAFKLK
ncbi:phage tail tape measure protein [Microbacterium rhizophilus]|uniref:phage tail tape measure protein n=1 Tax=Microbacterium rhizophilus TaxID=3138934 RepID=UPI0031EE2DCE